MELGFFEKGQKEPVTSTKFAAAERFFESAVAEARTALRKAPRNGRIRGTLGLALYRSGQREPAIEELKAALKDEPKSAEINNTLGVISYQTGKRDEALSYYQAAVALQADLADAYLNLAILYEEEYANFGKASSRDAAIRYYGLYRRYGGGDRDAQVEKAIKDLQGKAPAGGEPAAAGTPAAGKREPQ